MKLITAHRILIGAAIAFCLFFAVRKFWAFTGGDGSWALVESLGAVVVAGGFAVYFWTLRRWGRR